MTATQAVNTPQVAPLGTPTNTSSNSPTSANSTANAAASISKTFDQFLTLLTTQLKNQDPLSPQDSTQFTSQLVQFAQVEQAINSNTKLDSLISANQSNQLLQSASFIGRSVEATGNQGSFDGTNPLQFGYTLASQATTGTASIIDSNGSIVRTLPISLTTDHKTLSWDGKTDSGVMSKAGTYTIQVNAFDSTGKPVQATTTAIAKVTDIEIQNGQTMISLNGALVPLSSILSVKS